MKEIREQIEKQLAEKGMKQKELAEKLGTHPSNFNKRLRGGTMRVEELIRACSILGLEIKLEPINLFEG